MQVQKKEKDRNADTIRPRQKVGGTGGPTERALSVCTACRTKAGEVRRIGASKGSGGSHSDYVNRKKPSQRTPEKQGKKYRRRSWNVTNGADFRETKRKRLLELRFAATENQTKKKGLRGPQAFLWAVSGVYVTRA